jgi:hypothetical protein
LNNPQSAIWSLRAQRRHRIHPAGAAGGDEGGEQGDEREEDYDGGEDERIVGGGAEE